MNACCHRRVIRKRLHQQELSANNSCYSDPRTVEADGLPWTLTTSELVVPCPFGSVHLICVAVTEPIVQFTPAIVTCVYCFGYQQIRASRGTG